MYHDTVFEFSKLANVAFRSSLEKMAFAVAEGRQLYITLVGGGNSTHCFAPLACAQGHKVAILTRRPQDWCETVEVSQLRS